MSNWERFKQQIVESQVWRTMFRHVYEDTPRNRILAVSGNVWLHLRPSKVRKHGVRLKFTWCMGGITFLMFLITFVTGFYLMFYYRPVAEYAYADMKYQGGHHQGGTYRGQAEARARTAGRSRS